MKTVTELITESWDDISSQWGAEGPDDPEGVKALFYAAFSAGWRGATDYLHEAGQTELVSVLRGLRAEIGYDRTEH